MSTSSDHQRPAIIHDPSINRYCLVPPFDPPEKYPEIVDSSSVNPENAVYGMVRNLLREMGLDSDNFGSSEWNPFKEIIKPGMNVLIKPNLVTGQHYLGEDALYGSITHGSVLRPIVDYVWKAQHGQGTITIADNPIDGGDFERLMAFTGIHKMVTALVSRGYKELRVLDLRPQALIEGEKGKFCYKKLQGDPLGYINVDLNRDSLFADIDGEKTHYYTLADPAIDHLDPRCVRKSTTDKYHNQSAHKYVLSGTILNSDVVINVAKMKTHCKAGVSLTLKNMIGAVHLKECMPHHRPDMPPRGDSFPYFPASHYVLARKLYRFARRFLVHRLPGFTTFRNSLQKNKILVGQHIEHGNWKGNDTIWRTILDINRIIRYARYNGEMQDTLQRPVLSFIDGIISQEGEGPMAGTPLASSALLGGLNSVSVDALALKVMGIDPEGIKTVSMANTIKKWKLLEENSDLSFNDLPVPVFNFTLPKGWR